MRKEDGETEGGLGEEGKR
jgi:dynactin-4